MSLPAVLFCCLLVVPAALGAEAEDRPKTPELISISPTAAQRGSTVEVELHGRVLGGTYAVLFDSPLLTGSVEKVEPTKLKVTPEDMLNVPGQVAQVQEAEIA